MSGQFLENVRTSKVIETRRAKPLAGARFDLSSDFVCVNCRNAKPTSTHVCRSPKCACAVCKERAGR